MRPSLLVGGCYNFAMRSRFFLIANPGAGISRATLVDDVARLLEEAGSMIARVSTGDVAAAREMAHAAARSGHYDAIVAAGGDGTIRHIAAALVGSDVPLGIIPVGTGNVLAHEIRLPRTAVGVARTLLAGNTRKTACGHANGELFLLMVGAGFDARIVGALDQRFKTRLGKAAYAGPVCGALAGPMDTLSVSVDDSHHQASWAVITNARHYGGPFVLAPRTNVHQRGLEAILFKARSRPVLIGQLMSLALGRLEARAGRDIEMLACSRATISAHRPVPIQVDGDVFGSTPVEIEAGAEEIALIVPDRF